VAHPRLLRLLGLVAGKGTEGIEMDGDAGRLEKLISLTDQPDPRFNIVVP